MARTLTSTLMEAMYAQETSEALVPLIIVDHTDWETSFKMTIQYGGIVSNGETFVFIPFDLILPDDPSQGFSKGKLIVDGVSQYIIDEIRALQSPPTIEIQLVLLSDPDTVEIDITGFELTNINYDVFTISGDLSIESFVGEPYPSGSFTPSLFPGVF